MAICFSGCLTPPQSVVQSFTIWGDPKLDPPIKPEASSSHCYNGERHPRNITQAQGPRSPSKIMQKWWWPDWTKVVWVSRRRSSQLASKQRTYGGIQNWIPPWSPRLHHRIVTMGVLRVRWGPDQKPCHVYLFALQCATSFGSWKYIKYPVLHTIPPLCLSMSLATDIHINVYIHIYIYMLMPMWIFLYIHIWRCPIHSYWMVLLKMSSSRVRKVQLWDVSKIHKDIPRYTKIYPNIQRYTKIYRPGRGPAPVPGRAGRPRRRLVFCISWYIFVYLGYIWI